MFDAKPLTPPMAPYPPPNDEGISLEILLLFHVNPDMSMVDIEFEPSDVRVNTVRSSQPPGDNVAGGWNCRLNASSRGVLSSRFWSRG